MQKIKLTLRSPLVILLVALIFVFSCKKSEDSTPPGLVTDLTAEPSDSSVILKWTDPPDADLADIEITVTPGSYNPFTVPKGTQGVKINGLPNGTLFTFSLVSLDNSNNRSVAVTIDAKPNSPLVITTPDQNNYNSVGQPTFTLDGQNHVKISVVFNRSIDLNTLLGGETIYIKSATDIITGSVSYESASNTAVFTTTDPISTWCSFSPDCNFKFVVVGTDAGQGAVKDVDGMPLDGDEDGEPGGNYELTLGVVG
jgi:hypothetical protein